MAPLYSNIFSRSHASFPHETTADQFFSESQFESYRALGRFTIDQLVEKHSSVSKALGNTGETLKMTVDKFAKRVAEILKS